MITYKSLMYRNYQEWRPPRSKNQSMMIWGCGRYVIPIGGQSSNQCSNRHSPIIITFGGTNTVETTNTNHAFIQCAKGCTAILNNVNFELFSRNLWFTKCMTLTKTVTENWVIEAPSVGTILANLENMTEIIYFLGIRPFCFSSICLKTIFNSFRQFLFPFFLLVVRLSWNFLRFHKILFQTDAKNFSFISWKREKMYS